MFIKIEVSKIETSVERLMELSVTYENRLKEKLKQIHFNQLVDYCENIINKQSDKYLSKNKKNLNRLIEMKFGNLIKQNVQNLSSYQLDEKELNCLSYGMNFSLPIKKVDRVATYLGFEKYLNQLSKLKPISKEEEVRFKAN